MSNLIITKVDETFIHIEAERSLLQELSTYFEFYVPGYQFVPAYKNKLWDGKIRMLDLRTCKMYHGLVPYIEKFCEERDYKVFIEPSVSLTENFSIKEANEFIETLKLPFEVRDYQVNSFVHAIRNKRILLLSPTASGKSLILYLILSYIQYMDFKKGLLIVPTTSLCYQMYNDFKDYSKNDKDFNVDDEVSIIMAGKDKNPNVDRIKVTLENDKVCYFKPNQQIKTKKGIILAKNLTIEDDLL